MTDFEQRRNNYLLKLGDNIEVTKKIIAGDVAPGIKVGQQTVRVLVMPQTELELKYADTMFNFVTDLNTLTDDIRNCEADSIDIGNSELASVLSDLIVAIDIEDEERIEANKALINNMSYTKEGAKLYYDMQFLTTDKALEELTTQIICKTGYQYTDRFIALIGEAVNIFNTESRREFDVQNEKLVAERVTFMEAFRELCALSKSDKIKSMNLD